jgi:hypothetical protein
VSVDYDWGMVVLRRWWPLAAIVGGAIVAQTVVLAGYEAKGHAAGHLSSAQFVFLAFALTITILWATPKTRRQPDVLAAGAAWLGAVGAFALGNLRVVDAIGSADWTDDEAGLLGAGLPGFESGHDLAESAAPVALVAAIALAIVVWRRGHVSTRIAIGACATSVLVPFFLIPGAGVVVLAVALCLRRRARLSAAAIDL